MSSPSELATPTSLKSWGGDRGPAPPRHGFARRPIRHLAAYLRQQDEGLSPRDALVRVFQPSLVSSVSGAAN